MPGKQESPKWWCSCWRWHGDDGHIVPPESILLQVQGTSLTIQHPLGDTRWRMQLAMGSGIQENISPHSWTRKHENLTSKQRKLSLSEIWIQSRKMRKTTGDFGSQTQVCESSPIKRPGMEEQGEGRADAWDPITVWSPDPPLKISTSPSINAEKQSLLCELWLEIWSQGYVSTIKEPRWGEDMEHTSWWTFWCVNSMGGLRVWSLEL